jgi:hypothetical protein
MLSNNTISIVSIKPSIIYSLFILLVLILTYSAREELAPNDKIKIFQNPREMKRDIDFPYSLLVTSTNLFKLQFWFKSSTKTNAEIDYLFGFISKSDVTKGLQILLNYENFSPLPEPEHNYQLEIIDHGQSKSFSGLNWTLAIFYFTFEETIPNQLDLTLRLYLGNLNSAVSERTINFENTSMGEQFYLSFCSSLPFDSFCKR